MNTVKFVLFLTLVFMVGCSNDTNGKNSSNPNEGPTSQQPATSKQPDTDIKEVESEPHEQELKLFKSSLKPIPKDLVQNSSELRKRVERIDNFIGFDYQVDFLRKISKDHQNTNLEYVLKSILHKKMEIEEVRVETLSEGKDYTWVMVVTKDNFVLKMSFKRWEAYNNVWTLNAIGSL